MLLFGLTKHTKELLWKVYPSLNGGGRMRERQKQTIVGLLRKFNEIGGSNG
jgi:hypothetical protein